MLYIKDVNENLRPNLLKTRPYELQILCCHEYKYNGVKAYLVNTNTSSDGQAHDYQTRQKINATTTGWLHFKTQTSWNNLNTFDLRIYEAVLCTGKRSCIEALIYIYAYIYICIYIRYMTSWIKWNCDYRCILNRLDRVTHIWVSKLTIIGSDNGLSPDRRQAIIWINSGI